MLGSVIIALLLRIGGTALWLIFTIIVARAMSVEDFGYVFFVINAIMTGGAIAVMGYDVTVVRFGSLFWKAQDKQGFRDLLSEARRAIVIIGLMATFALAIGTMAGLDTPVTQELPVAILIGASIVAVGLMSVERDTLRAAGKLQEALFAFSVIRALVPLVLTFIAWLLGALNPDLVLVFYLVALLAALGWDRWRIGKLGLPPRVGMAAPHLKVALSTWPGNAALVVFQRAPTIVIGLTGGLGAAGLFIAAERISQLGSFLTDAVRTAVGPNLAQADSDDRQQAVTHASLLMLISGSVGLVLLLALGAVLLWMFGPEYRSAFPALLMLLLGQLSWTILGPTALVLNMMGHNKTRSVISVAATLALLILLPIFDTAFGAATVVAFISWAMNIALWVAILLRLGLRSGIFGLSLKSARDIWAEERHSIVNKLKKRRKSAP